SLQIREDNLRLALLNGFSPYNKGNDEIAVAFRPDFFVNYIQSMTQLHSFGTSPEEFSVLEEGSNPDIELNMARIEQVAEQRQSVVVQLNKKVRDTGFKARVLNAYGHRCAFSGMQLKLIDAAHILPVNINGSTDDTSNGIALSALYHRAFDRGIVTLDEGYHTIINNHKIDKFRVEGLDGGLDEFLGMLRPIIHVPPAVNDRPHVNFINTANRLRGWNF